MIIFPYSFLLHIGWIDVKYTTGYYKMIDTINFRLNNVSKYPIIETQFQNFERDGKTNFYIDKDSGEVFDNSKIRAILHHDSDTVIPISSRSSMYIASSHYSVSYHYKYANNFIDFNFSVPKYMFGTNIIQAVKYYGQDAETQFKLLREFMTSFCKKHFMDEIDFKDIEITRVDLCYNQFFNCKYDAMKYLSEQKELMKKHARSTKNDYRSYESSLMYTTGRYSFKIYHKGTEFNKHDRKELAKTNPTGHTLNDLQDISDKILRYEVTFRKSQINYLFEKAELYRSYVPALVNDDERSWQTIFYPKIEAKHVGRKTMLVENREKTIRHRQMEFIKNSKSFVLAGITNEYALQNQTATFDQKTFNQLYTFFWDYVRKYQLRLKVNVYDVVQKINQLNERRDNLPKTSKALRSKLSYNAPMLTTLALLTQYQSIDELRKSELLSKSTFYRYKKQLAELGIDSETRLEGMPLPSLDYQDYFYYFRNHHIK